MLRIYPHWGFEKSIPELLYCWQPHKYWVILPTIQRLPILGVGIGGQPAEPLAVAKIAGIALDDS
jgi:hypothetical protein